MAYADNVSAWPLTQQSWQRRRSSGAAANKPFHYRKVARTALRIRSPDGRSQGISKALPAYTDAMVSPTSKVNGVTGGN